MLTQDETSPPTIPPKSGDAVRPMELCILGLYHAFLGLGLAWMLLVLWPPSSSGAPGSPGATQPAGFTANLDDASRTLLLVMVIGALGSFIHATVSLTDFAGNRTLTRSWIPWYLLRPFIGMAMALIFYFVIRAGFMAPSDTSSDLNLYGIAAMAGIVGMFSKQASDKLRDLFDALFRPHPGHGDEQRKDKLTGNPVPVLENVTPAELTTAGADALAARGSQFVANSVVRVNGQPCSTEFVSASELRARVDALLLAGVSAVQVDVFSPEPGGGSSKPITVAVQPEEVGEDGEE